MLKIANTSVITCNAEFALLPAMFVVSDYVSVSSGKNRKVVAEAIMKEIESIFKDIDRIEFDRHCELYGEIIRDKKLRCEWFMGNDAVQTLGDNAISKCIILLGDIIYNPECAINYDEAPIMVHDIFETFSFVENVMKPLFKEYVSLFQKIYNF